MPEILSLERTFAEFINTRAHIRGPIVVGVSGGADSMGLCLVAHNWAIEQGLEFWAVTVDHDLRSDSGAEAIAVGEILTQHGINHKIIKWQDYKPQTRIQEMARKARYDLLISFAQSIGGDCLLVAHHAMDQAETFLIRLMAGSGGDGLAAMAPTYESRGCQILRPFLTTNPQEIRDYLRAKKISWIEDPSNLKQDFQRVRVRNFLNQEGLNPERIHKMIDKFREDRDFFERERDSWINDNVTGIQGIYWHIISLEDFRRLHNALARRIISTLLHTIFPTDYGIRTGKLNGMLSEIRSENFTGATLGGCQIIKRRGGIHIQREAARIDHEITLPASGTMWDKRIPIESSFGNNGLVRKIAPEYICQLKATLSPAKELNIPSIVWLTLPMVESTDGTLIVPHLEVLFPPQ